MVIGYLLYAERILLQERSLQIMNELVYVSLLNNVERLWESGGLHLTNNSSDFKPEQIDMNRGGIMLLRGAGRAGSAIVCYGRRGSPICHLLMWQYSSLSHHKGKVTYETKTQQKRTKTTSSVTLTHMLLVLIASSMFRR